MSNISKVRAMAETMSNEVRAVGCWRVPDWAGLAWIMSAYYCCDALAVQRHFGPAWVARARRLVRALAVAAEWRQEQRMALPDEW